VPATRPSSHFALKLMGRAEKNNGPEFEGNPLRNVNSSLKGAENEDNKITRTSDSVYPVPNVGERDGG